MAAAPSVRDIDSILAELGQVLHIRLGVLAVRVAVTLIDGQSFQSPIPRPATAPTPPAVDAAVPLDEPATPPHSRPNAHDRWTIRVIQTLEDKGERMTTGRLLSAFARAGTEVSQRTLAGILSQLVEEGTLTNNQSAKPPGYGLPEWVSTSDE